MMVFVCCEQNIGYYNIGDKGDLLTLRRGQFLFLTPTGVELQLRMAGDSRVLMDRDMEIGVTPGQVNPLRIITLSYS